MILGRHQANNVSDIFLFIFKLRGNTKHLLTAPTGNSKFRSPKPWRVSLALPLGPVIVKVPIIPLR